jgi:hypothetical protein
MKNRFNLPAAPERALLSEFLCQQRQGVRKSRIVFPFRKIENGPVPADLLAMIRFL